MATEDAKGTDSPPGAGQISFRCHGCGVRFLGDPAGPGRCPRCGAIGGHDRLGRPTGGES